MTTYRKRLLALGVALATLSGPAAALQDKNDSPDDYRIKTVAYSETDVVQIDAVVGLTTHIWLDDDEEYVTHAFGDSAGWELAENGNHVFIKPAAVDGDTNLILITNERVYNILLDYIDDYQDTDAAGNAVSRSIETPWSMRSATIQLRYTYPEQERELRMAQERANAERRRVSDRLQGNYRDSDVNVQYSMSNDPASAPIRPMNVWDDHRFTYFKFPAGASLPNLYVIGPDGEETLVNTHIEGEANNIIVAHQVAQRWFIRSGERVIGLLNHGYNPTDYPTTTGTSSTQVQRVVNDEGQVR